MTNPIVTAGQGFFANGLEPTLRGIADATKFVGLTADAEMGSPIAILGASLGAGDEQGKLHTNPSNAGQDAFYGVSASNINNLLGRVSLGEFEAKRADVWRTGQYIVRRSVFLNANNQEVTISPFDGTFPKVADIGKAVHALNYTTGPTEIVDTALTGSATKPVLKWVLAAAAARTGGTAAGFFQVAQVVGATGDLTAGESSECELWLPGTIELYNDAIVP